MEIRNAKQADAFSIADIHATSWRVSYQNVLSKEYLKNTVLEERVELWTERLRNPKPNQCVIVAESLTDDIGESESESDRNIVGFACFYAGDNPEWGSYLDNLHILKAYQSQGIGQLLIQKGTHWCFQQEPTKGMCLLVNQNNLKAQALYQRLGARNAKESVWNAPDGSIVPTYWFVWDQLTSLMQNS